MCAPEDDQHHSYCAYRSVPQRIDRITANVSIPGRPRGWPDSQLLCLSLGAPEDGKHHSYCAYRSVPPRMARITATVPIAGCPRGWPESQLLCLSLGAREDGQNHSYRYRSTCRRAAAVARKLRLQLRLSSTVADTESAFQTCARIAAQTQTACQSGADGCLGADCVSDSDAVAAQAR